MTSTTAAAILQAGAGLGARPSSARANVVIRAWLRAEGWEEDRYGNLKLASLPDTRWHFTAQRVKKQKKTGQGEWFDVLSQSPADTAIALMRSAASASGDPDAARAAGDAERKRADVRKASAARAKDKAFQERVHVLTMKIIAWEFPDVARDVVFGRQSDSDAYEAAGARQRALMVEMALDPSRVRRLEAEAWASLDHPPLLPLHRKEPEYGYRWDEVHEGVRYSVRVAPRGGGKAIVWIGKPQGHMDVDPLSGWVSSGLEAMAADLHGDAYIAGAVGKADDEVSGLLYIIQAAERRAGAGARVLRLWCRLMTGYGVRLWRGRAAGEEGAPFLLALHRRGEITIHGQDGPDLLMSCGVTG